MRILGYLLRPMLMALLMIGLLPLTSCESLYDDIEACPTGVRLRFIYEYNMNFDNAFSQVDCLTLFIYDSEGNYIGTRTGFKPEISAPEYRMTLDLEPGKYSMIAYGGMECEESSFSFVTPPESTREQDLDVELKPEYLLKTNDKPLHHLYYGALDIEVPEPGNGTTYTDGTVYMIKDTNDIRIILANETGIPTDEADFEFTIEDNNRVLNWQNLPAEQTMITYYPWAKGNVVAGIYGTDKTAQMAYAEISTSRLMADSHAVLKINRVSDGFEVASIPLITFLKQLRSDRYKWMTPQEFLDRQSMWNLTFILTGSGEWTKVSIVINDWLVRINDIEQ
ncbi:MAG: FimB/Mfa2 family fimbrial subunit [Muribaculaceae bacterium]|nr:FimB/Mfa2 family fimbrial subunit [Muribaculaceae bacterium]